jgi:diguanylate cyclase (GGDEF)-like protein
MAEERKKVLIVDDSRVMRAALNSYLKKEFEVTQGEDGESGWEVLIADTDINVVVADVEMPLLDGYALICRIRASEDPRIKDIPVIIITGAEDEETRERAYACGASDFITKPIDKNQLLAHVHAQAKVDETTLRMAEDSIDMAKKATIDALTKLSSHTNLLQRGEQDLAYAIRRNDDLSVVRIDVDNFKNIHDEYGNEKAQKILIWIAEILKELTRTEDTISRDKGAEFSIIAPSAGRLEIAVLCERLRSGAAKAPFTDGDHSIPVTVSIGFATYGRDQGETINELLSLADKRARSCRAAGGNRLAVGDEDEATDEPVIQQPNLERALLMVKENQGGDLIPYLPELLLKVMPLLNLGNDKLDLEIDLMLSDLNEKLNKLK